MRIFVAAFLVFCSFSARADLAPAPLKLAYPAQSSLDQPVSVKTRVDGDILSVDWEVRTTEINAKKVLGPNEYPYMFDVVEIFVSVNKDGDHRPYYEFELSPYDQGFEVHIINAHKMVNGVHVGTQHSVQRTGDGWTAHLEIPLKNLGWDGNQDSLIGGVFAVLGKHSTRSYWGLYLPQEAKPNFHRPEFFGPL